MALGRQGAVQNQLLIGWHEVPVAPGHVFYDRLNGLLDKAGFDREVEALCTAHYASGVGRPGVPPGRYFRMLFVGYFEGLESERGIAWRCADSLSLRRFLQLGTSEAVPDHSTLSRPRARLPLEVHEAVFALVLRLVAQHGLIKGRRVGIDASTMEANAAMRAIVRREDGAGWQAMRGELARTSGIATPTTDQLRQFAGPARASGSRMPTGSARRAWSRIILWQVSRCRWLRRRRQQPMLAPGAEAVATAAGLHDSPGNIHLYRCGL